MPSDASCDGMESYNYWIGVLLSIALSLKYVPTSLAAVPTQNGQKDEITPLVDDANAPDDDSVLQRQKEQAAKMKEFASFQKWYIVIFLLAMLADWMQGPYVYKLYSAYNLPTQSIAILFIIGFGASGITGAFVGGLADKFGRRNMCILFCVLYSASCATKHFHEYNILVIGRFLGGVSTSILFSCFESWMVTHHKSKGYPDRKLGDTFEKAWSLNSFIAILAGIITSFAVGYYQKHNLVDGPNEIAAFDCSAITLIIACVAIHLRWKQENYGDSQINMKQSLSNALELFQSDRRIILVGVIQSGFESAMYLFVFMWTMALESARGEEHGAIDHGMVFAVFMESCLVGTTLSGTLSDHFAWKTEKIATVCCAIGGVALLCIPYTEEYELRLSLFVVFECCVGVYFPIIGSIRGRYVPDNVRATIMNIFRIPLNVIVVIVLCYIDALGLERVFQLAFMLLMIAAAASYSLNTHKAVAKEIAPTENGH